jgi:hypothetical protein
MHKITHRKLVIEFDVWEEFQKQVNDEIGLMAAQLRTRQLLGHVGKMHMTDIEESVKTIE